MKAHPNYKEPSYIQKKSVVGLNNCKMKGEQKKTNMEQIQEQNEVKPYEMALNNMANILNYGKGKDAINGFISCLRTFQNEFGLRITTDFLKDLMTGSNRQKLLRIKYLIRICELKQEKEIKFSKEWKFETEKKEVIEWEHFKGVVYSDFPYFVLDEDDDKIIMEKEPTKYGKHEISKREQFNKKGLLSLRNAINNGTNPQGVRVALNGVRVIETGKEYIGTTPKTFYYITGF